MLFIAIKNIPRNPNVDPIQFFLSIVVLLINFENIGVTQKDHFELDKDLKISVKELYEMNNKWYNKFNGLTS